MRPSKIALSVVVLLLVAGFSAPPVAAEGCSTSCSWGYGPKNGPQSWAEICCPVCAGRDQSPVDIRLETLVGDAQQSLVVKFRESHLEFVNNGHTLEASDQLAAGENHILVDDVRYDLAQFHFHSLSEHTIDGRHSPLELHFVHQRTSYDLAVIAVLIDEGEENPEFAAMWNSLPATPDVLPRTIIIHPRKLLPHGKLPYYTYRGSLTTPNCSEIVTWFVVSEPLTMSVEQIEAFRAIFSDNYRPVQPLNGRQVRGTP